MTWLATKTEYMSGQAGGGSDGQWGTGQKYAPDSWSGRSTKTSAS